MGSKLALAGLVVALFCPVAFGIGMVLSQFMPSCKVGSGGPAYGCILAGVDISLLMHYLLVLGLLGSFFLVPAGLLLVAVGGVVSLFGKKRGPAA